MAVFYRLVAIMFSFLVFYGAAVIVTGLLKWLLDLRLAGEWIALLCVVFAATATWLLFRNIGLLPKTDTPCSALAIGLTVGILTTLLVLIFKFSPTSDRIVVTDVGPICDKAAAKIFGLPTFVDPPEPSGRINLPLAWLGFGVRTVGDAADRLEAALRRAGYFEYSYHYLRCGFAMVTRLEQINDDGSPLSGDNRWNNTLITGMREFSLAEYLRVLFLAPTGRYRIIVFVVSPDGLPTIRRDIPRGVAEQWLSNGALSLHRVFDEVPLNRDYALSALIYEFYVAGRQEEPKLVRPGTLSSNAHLEKAGLLCRRWDGDSWPTICNAN